MPTIVEPHGAPAPPLARFAGIAAASGAARLLDEHPEHVPPSASTRYSGEHRRPVPCAASMDAVHPGAWHAFNRIASSTTRDLALLGQLHSAEKATLLRTEGAADDAVIVVLTGRLRAFSAGNDEREVTYDIYGPGDLIGEAVSDGSALDATLVVEETACCAIVERALLDAYLLAHPLSTYELLARSNAAHRRARLRIKQLALYDAYTRLAAFLRSNAMPTPTGSAVLSRFTHQSLSRLLGCSREMISRLLKDLERGGYIHTDGANWVLGKPLPARW